MSTLAQLSVQFGVSSPHELFARLRAEHPVIRLELPSGVPIWLLTRHDDVRAALNDPRLSTRVGGPLTADVLAADIRAGMSTHMLRVDGDDHRRLRRLVSSAFTARRIERLRPEIERLTAEQLDVLGTAEHPDVVRDLAFPLPLRVIHELLGVPVEGQARMREWSTVYLTGLATQVPPAGVLTEVVHYLRDLVARKRSEPDDRLLSAMIEARDAGDRLSEDELTSMCFLLVVAGYETVMNLIGTSVHQLLTDPALKARLAADPAAAAGAVEEFLRFESPTGGASFRVALEDLTLGGTPIAKGELVSLSLLSANRDAEVFVRAEAFDAGRSPNPHVAFGHGVHFCLGAPLARLETTVVVNQLLRRFPDLTAADPVAEPKWWPGAVVRGLSELPVRLGASARTEHTER